MKQRASSLFKKRQEEICSAFEQLDGKESFSNEVWEHHSGGGGVTRVIQDGSVFEKGGVNFSEVNGELPAEMCKRLLGEDRAYPFYATGISLVLHPYSPMVPTVHANFRYLEIKDKAWFGGGADLTPYYLFEEDAKSFHSVWKKSLDNIDPEYYPKFKKRCDEYFFLPHRQEARGIGGIFFDYLGRDEPEKIEFYFKLVEKVSSEFINSYLPIAAKCKNQSWGEHEKSFQLLRRGRYVEFNLVYDLGTQFGLRTSGRTESILMSLPPVVNWKYNSEFPLGEREQKLMQVINKPRDWV